jgi:hypothetical protein
MGIIIENVTYFQALGISKNISNASYVLRGTQLEWEDERDAPSRDQIDTWGTEAETRVKLRRLRLERNSYLLETDWSQSADVPEATKTKWQVYRQELRDITNTYSSIDTVIWPTRPE